MNWVGGGWGWVKGLSATCIGVIGEDCEGVGVVCQGQGRVRGLPGQARVLVRYQLGERSERA